MSEDNQPTRRGLLAQVLMAGGLLAAYGTLGVQGLMFLLPRRLRPRTRLLFAGQASEYELGSVRTVYDLEGNPILIKRSADGFAAFSSTCPHLGCRVRWEEGENRFFCPCHRGVFDPEGIATAGPPADAAQRLADIPLKVDERSGVVYLEVRDPGRRRG